MPTQPRAIAVPGGHLHAVAEGDGPPIVLVHAGIADLRSWDGMVPPLVAAGHRVVRYDVRGHGRSPTEDVEFTHRDDLRAVLDGLGIERALLVGNSRGAMLSLDTAVETPERVAAVVTVGGGVGGFETENLPEDDELERRWAAVEASGDLDALNEFEVALWVDGPGQPAGRAPAAVRRLALEMNRPLLEPDRVMGRERTLDPPANDRLAEIRCPVVVVVGSLDTRHTRLAGPHIADSVAAARLVEIPGVAHMVGMEVPDRLAALVVELAGSLPPWA